jgi:hypothetical protein
MIPNLQEIFIQIARNVNSSLPYYDKGFVSVKRTPVGDKERVDSLEQFIECRLNYECFEVPELRPFAEAFDGHLFEILEVLDKDEHKRRFSFVRAEICKKPEIYIGERDFLESLSEIQELLGGSILKFNYSQKKTKISIE